jgi:DNA-binding CsgD family transcriptional regulator
MIKEYKPPRGARLSRREKEMLELMLTLHRRSDVADAMNLSVKTVSTYRARLLEKTGCINDAQLGVWAERRRNAAFDVPQVKVELTYNGQGNGVAP